MNPSAGNLQRPGFTLVEMVVSMAIGTVVLLTAAYLLGRTGDGYDRVGGAVAAEREARAAVRQLRSDMESAIHHPQAAFTAAGGAVSFLSLQPAEAQNDDRRIGDVCAVNYRLSDITSGGRVTRVLTRGFRDSGDAFAALATGQAGSLFTPRDLLDEPVAFGVLAFEATPVIRNPSGNWTSWTAARSAAPEAIDVRIVIARREYAARLRTASDWDRAAAELAADAETNSDLEVYQTRIRYGHHDGS